MQTIERETPCGKIRGCITENGIEAYRGIRYASAGRWRYPVPVRSWEGIYDALSFGPNAMQMAALSAQKKDGNEKPSFYEHEFREGLPYTYSEDCQYLNIYAPRNAQKAPVIIYIHGGAYMGGSGWDKVFDEPVWPQHGAIAVTLNYRLGIFGSVSLPELEEESGHTGNYQTYDQLAAVEWVHDNIATYGGDPDNITVMGQSAGARSVQMLVGSPRMKGIIKHAVLSSGGGVPSHLFNEIPSQDEAKEFWTEWKNSTGAASLEELRTMPAEKIMASLFPMMGKYGFHKAIGFISPVYDRKDLPVPGSDPELPGGWLEIPYLVGANTEDIVPGLAQDASNWAAGREVPSYAYCFARQLPGDTNGAFHSADLWYWFGTLQRSWRPMTEKDLELSDKMVRALVRFAQCGDPNIPGLPEWPAAGSRKGVMWFDEQCRVEEAPVPETQKGLML